MKRKVYLVGEIEKRFGSEFSMYADNYGEIIRNIDCNRPGFKEYLLDCHRDGINFTINFAGKNIEEKELLTPIKEGDVTITAIPAGSKSEIGQILVAVALIVVGFYVGGMKGAMLGVEYAKWGSMITAVGMSLAIQGIQSMLAPDPATDAEEEEGYLYTGSEAIVVEGDPVPVLYGKLRVPGQPVSVAINTAGSLSNFSGAGFGWPSASETNDETLCFDPDTFIQMADGSEKKIKYIKLGDNTKGGEVIGVFQFKAADEIHDYKGVTVAGSHFVKENGEFIMVKDSPLAIKIDRIPIVFSLDTTGRRIFINDIEFADYNGDGIAKNFLNNAGVSLKGFDKEVLRQVELRLI